MAFDFLTTTIAEQKQRARYRVRQCVAEQNGRYVNIDHKSYLNFSSNDYLGLNHHPKINQALQAGAERFGTCASGSSLITGYSYAHQALENDICDWLNKAKCLLFASGFSANNALMHALGHKSCELYLDKLSHASLIDGALSSDAKVKRFLHNDTEQLQSFLRQGQAKANDDGKELNQVIVSEGVFSMDGDQADVTHLAKIAQEHKALLYLDDAHSMGVVGDKGQGSSSIAVPDIVMATFGKSIATSGAFVACDELLADYLVNFSRHYIYSTAISPALAWATKKSIEIIQTENWRREKIVELSQLLASKLSHKVQLINNASSIHAIVIGDEVATLDVCQKLRDKGIWLSAIRPPTVPKNSSRLRVTVTSSHEIKDINYLANCINEVIA
ncbi:8-amino-7-oxononanoate synthase [Colwellia sp. MB02u-18]|uniref:aminotransferase class I/II-fold pyridoxal phosphate-dependent enzyme n=1 Tax=unclassified Colwellia TaxID=196834 RepID=UPI0015F4299D|nr:MULTISPECIES: 8-amino-7-oxononanoate synthase [unclassified Colwellia]MBA6224751.1 8-amino-7-oxononanoate synthase [Colwellia sp. MB3u-45]MBA6266797.1 8-amino-7-oxononanoate synthase [Colwellia sp. MB3u-43]MBA6321392.1 8-amino-7-oxononanoate synthase [Colwellia sp. MB02u-19]MBA6323599.1 8-amino-7-oxononanoate synthase [Colwellia sp. MB02u-18]MBA6332420.1 8-amino-7-oxononanoate synthase [Colwellia sp. MB02u-12]